MKVALLKSVVEKQCDSNERRDEEIIYATHCDDTAMVKEDTEISVMM